MTIQTLQLYSHFAGLRMVCAPFTKQALSLLERGDQKGAFRLLDAVLGAARALRRNSDSLSIAFIGFSIEKDVWRQVAATDGVVVAGNSADDQLWRKAVDAFGRVASRADRPDLGSIAQLELQGGIKDRHEAEDPYYNNPVESFARSYLGVSEAELRIGTQGAFLLTYAAQLAFAGALLWILGRIWSSDASLSPTRGEIARSANFSFWCLLGVFALLWYLNVGANFVLFFSQLVGPETPLFQPRQMAVTALPVVALLTWLLPLAWIAKRGHRSQPKLIQKTKPQSDVRVRPLFVIRALLRIFCVVLYAIAFGSGATIWEGTLFDFPVPLFAAGFCLIALLAVEAVLWKRGDSRLSLRNPVVGFLGFALLVMGTTWIVVARSPLSIFWQIPALVAVGLVITLLPWQRSDSQPLALDVFIAGAGRSAGALAVAWSLFFLIGALAIWPVRAKLNRQLDRMLVVGERAWRAEQTK